MIYSESEELIIGILMHFLHFKMFASEILPA